MSWYTSKFANKLDEYMVFRKSLGFSNRHAQVLRQFDAYCAQFQPNAAELTKEVVRGWFDFELGNNNRNLDKKVVAIRSFAKYIGGKSYILPMDYAPKKGSFVPNILDDDELFAFFVPLTISIVIEILSLG